MYNSLSKLPTIPYNILVYLARQDEIIWKLLKYNDYDALSKPDLTFDEKIALIWKSGPQEKFGVFQTMLVEDAICESKCILKIYDYYIHAKELYSSTAVYAFDFLYGGQMSLVDYEGTPVSRGDLFINRILTVLNGADVGGVGESGMGAYHGKVGFDTFSHKKSIVDKKTWIDVNMRYQPYTKSKETFLRLFLK